LKTEPTSKPIEVFAIPMRQHTKPGEVCYEPFSGSGSQIIAGEATGRRVYAIEISPQYVDVALKRWQTATGKHAELDADGRSFDEIAGERLPRAA
jgi:DNA modification methylase